MTDKKFKEGDSVTVPGWAPLKVLTYTSKGDVVVEDEAGFIYTLLESRLTKVRTIEDIVQEAVEDCEPLSRQAMRECGECRFCDHQPSWPDWSWDGCPAALAALLFAAIEEAKSCA